MKFRGKLSRWNDERGFGFITPTEGGEDVFVHISALKKSGSRPSVGDSITFEVHSDESGKKRAVNATVDGVPSGRIPRKKPSLKEEKNGGVGAKILVFGILAIISVAIYKQFNSQSYSVPKNRENTPITGFSQKVLKSSYSCQGKIYCSEMTSCDEAKYYIQHCPGTKMDGDNDGVPCESQWCT